MCPVQEPGTALHTLHLTTSTVPGLRPLPGGGRLYITPSLSKQQLHQLVNALEALYAEDTQEAQETQPRKMPGAAAAQQSSVPEPAAAEAAAAKRRRTDQLQQQPSQQSPSGNPSVIRLIIRDQLGLDVHFSVKPHTKMEKVMIAYVEQKSLDLHAVKFLFDGQRVQPHRTPEDYRMEDGEVIDCTIESVGC
jgi:small ubiquitin-related modifier